MDEGTTILFGLPGVAVDRVERVADEQGETVRLVHVTTASVSAAGCPACGVISTSVKQYRATRPRDLPYGEERLEVVWGKWQYRYREEACPRTAFTESIAEVPPRARLTGRLCRKAAAASGRSVSAVAATRHVRGASEEEARKKIEDELAGLRFRDPARSGRNSDEHQSRLAPVHGRRRQRPRK